MGDILQSISASIEGSLPENSASWQAQLSALRRGTHAKRLENTFTARYIHRQDFVGKSIMIKFHFVRVSLSQVVCSSGQSIAANRAFKKASHPRLPTRTFDCG